MTLFWVGFLGGGALVHVLTEIYEGRLRREMLQKIYKCNIEMARVRAMRALDSYSDEELVSAIAKGLDLAEKPRDNKPR